MPLQDVLTGTAGGGMWQVAGGGRRYAHEVEVLAPWRERVVMFILQAYNNQVCFVFRHDV